MRRKGYCDLGFAKVDTDRLRRRGFPEVVYAPGKSIQQLIAIARKILSKGQILLLTRIDQEAYSPLKKSFPGLRYNPTAKVAYIKKNKPVYKARGFVLIVTAGTSDLAIAEEAAITLEVIGSPFRRLYDVGVAGVHRVVGNKALLRKAGVIIVVAGMEGALASIVSGLVSSAVIAVPTSIGYGASFKGLSALLTMLNSCSPGVGVVNIDNGFGAGYLAAIINRA